MPRQARKKSETGVYHVILRGINRQTIFIDDEDRRYFLSILAHFIKVSGCELYAYCLMSNHIHLQIQEGLEPLGTTVKRITSKYVLWYNRKHERCGHLFQERFKSEPIETFEYFITVVRYIHQNPQKAYLQDKLDHPLWTSYWEFVRTPRLVNVDFVLSLISDHRSEAVERFINYINHPCQESCMEYEERTSLSDKEVQEFVEKLGVKLGDIKYLDKIVRDEIIVKIKMLDGVTIRQVAKLTGLSKSLISRI